MISDALMILGLVLTLTGVALVHIPSAIAVTGVLMILIGFFSGSQPKRRS